MSHIRKPSHGFRAGYDAERNLQVLPVGKKTSFYLIAADDLVVSIDDPGIATVSATEGDDKNAHKDKTLTSWEKGQVISVIRVAAVAEGSTKLRAKYLGLDWIEPLTVRVTQNADYRQVGKGKGEVTPELRQEIQGLPLREAVIRVAEDQLNSRICHETRGFGIYNMDKSYDWCGGFAYWCWEQACAIKGVSNPFGPKNSVLWSPQRALHWGMQPDTWGQILRWSGASPMDGKGRQEYREIGWSGYQLERGDVVLVRKDKAHGWKHVCLVHTLSGTDLLTIDGNQGQPCIQKRKRSLTSTLPGGGFTLVYIHALGI